MYKPYVWVSVLIVIRRPIEAAYVFPMIMVHVFRGTKFVAITITVSPLTGSVHCHSILLTSSSR